MEEEVDFGNSDSPSPTTFEQKVLPKSKTVDLAPLDPQADHDEADSMRKSMRYLSLDVQPWIKVNQIVSQSEKRRRRAKITATRFALANVTISRDIFLLMKPLQVTKVVRPNSKLCADAVPFFPQLFNSPTRLRFQS